MGVPQNGWFIRENPMNQWMIGGTPIYGNPDIYGTAVLFVVPGSWAIFEEVSRESHGEDGPDTLPLNTAQIRTEIRWVMDSPGW